MTILVKIFGNLRKKIEGSNVTNSLPISKHIESNGIETIADILNKLAIKKEETSHLFVNGTYSGFNKKVKDPSQKKSFVTCRKQSKHNIRNVQYSKRYKIDNSNKWKPPPKKRYYCKRW